MLCKILYVVGLLGVSAFANPILGQDYFEDIRGNGNPISVNLNKNLNLSARLNVGDNSAKANLFRVWRAAYYEKANGTSKKLRWKKRNKFPDTNETSKLNELVIEDFSNSARVAAPKSTFRLYDVGGGLSLKGKTKDGLGNLFTKGQFTGESQLGIYGVWHIVKVVEDVHKHNLVISPFVNFNFSMYRLLPDTSTSFTKVDSTVNRANYGISTFWQGYLKDKSQIIIGLSLTGSRQNNYDDLEKADLREAVIRVDSPITRTLTTVEDKGYTYGLGEFKEYGNVSIRPHVTWIPYALEYRGAIVFYPSADFSKLYADPLLNIGLGFHILEKENPTISTLGVFFELNDIGNAKAKQEPFMKRSFRVGLSAALNVSSLIQKEK